MNQIVNLQNSGEIKITASYRLIWYKRDVEVFQENEKVKSYKIELYFENGKSMKDYIVLPQEIMNIDAYIKENIKLLMILWMDRNKKMKHCIHNIKVTNIL